jgi:hypothetical protein
MVNNNTYGCFSNWTSTNEQQRMNNNEWTTTNK